MHAPPPTNRTINLPSKRPVEGPTSLPPEPPAENSTSLAKKRSTKELTSLPTEMPMAGPSYTSPIDAPSTSNSHSPMMLCPVADDRSCGCSIFSQADYRGEIDSTSNGMTCENWNADWIVEAFGFEPKSKFPDAGLWGHNYCRNPSKDPEGAYCLTKGSFVAQENGGVEMDIGSTMMTMCAVDGGGTSVLSGDDRILEDEEDGRTHNVDSKLVTATIEYCSVPTCDPCECTLLCGRPNPHDCACPSAFQAEECCPSPNNNGDLGEGVHLEGLKDHVGGADAGISCKCGYYREACRKSLEQNETHFCEDAELACCESSTDPRSCECGFYERLCSEFPFPYTCDRAAESCCATDMQEGEEDGFTWASTQCLCDFYAYTTSKLGYGYDSRTENCEEAAEYTGASSSLYEKAALEKLYQDTEGDSWFSNAGWLNDRVNHCDWFGLKCNEDGIVIELVLRKNNLAGGPPSVVSFTELTKLDLAENNLVGSLSGTKFWKLRNLKHVDISQNDFKGHADMYFAPATTYANYSHNRFASASFNRFNAAYETLRSVDLSHNSIDQSAVEVLRNIPITVMELLLTNNMVRGVFPDPFPFLGELTRFGIANNRIEGPIPWDFAVFPNLTMLDLADNLLDGSIPVAIGHMKKMAVFNVSGNGLNGGIPGSFGKLAGGYCCLWFMFCVGIYYIVW